MAVTIVNVGYRSTNFYVIGARHPRFLLDLGWMGMMGALLANLERKGIPVSEITHGVATHYHLDHAGLAQELKAHGMTLVVTPEQVPFVPRMKDHAKPQDHLTDVVLDDGKTRVVACAESRAFFKTIGLDGELVHTPGHSDDSVSLLLDDGSVFTGDLTHPNFVTEAEADVTGRSWQTLRERGAKTVYPGHGPVRAM